MFRINDIDVENKVLAINKIVDKSPRSDRFLRERGVLSYPTKYQTEKISVSLGFDLSVESHLNDFVGLAVEMDEYPFVFVRSEKVKSIVYKSYDRDIEAEQSSIQVFILERISLSIDSELKNFAAMNVVLMPFNIHGVIDDFSFITYETGENGEFTIKYGVDGPENSRVYQDFFASRRKEALEKTQEFLSSKGNSDVVIMSPYFSDEEPIQEGITYTEISYTDQGATVDTTKEGADRTDDDYPYSSFFSYKSDGTLEDKYKKTKYVYWRGDTFDSDPASETAVQSIEVSRVNHIAIQPIVSSPNPYIQYLGKSGGFFNATFVSSPTSGNSPVSPYSILRLMLENYNANLLINSKFNTYNFFKINSLLTNLFDLDGYIPAQVFLEETSEENMHKYTVSFTESSAIGILKKDFAIMEETKADEDRQTSVDSILSTHELILKAGLIDKSLLRVSIKKFTGMKLDNEAKDFSFLNDYINSEDGGDTQAFLGRFYGAVGLLMEYINVNSNGAVDTDTKLSYFFDHIQGIEDGKLPIAESAKDIAKKYLMRIAVLIEQNKPISGIPVTQDTTIANSEKLAISEFYRFQNEALPDLKLGKSFNISKDTPYLGVDDPRYLSSAPFLVWRPLVESGDIEEEYARTADEIDKFFDEAIPAEKRIENAAKQISREVGIDRGEPLGTYEEWYDGFADAAMNVVSPAIGFIQQGIGAVADILADGIDTEITRGLTNVLDWVALKDSGRSDTQAYNVVFCPKVNGGKNVVSMTVSQVLVAQKQWSINAQKNIGECHFKSHATGKYQAMGYTMESMISAGYLSRNELFNATAQERFGLWAATIKTGGRLKLANDFIKKRNLWKAGQLNYVDYVAARNRYQDQIANEWASMPKASGGYAHEGQGYVKVKDAQYVLDNLPLFGTKHMAASSSFLSQIETPVELGGVTPATVPTITGDTQVPVDQAPELPTNPATGEQAFQQKWAGIIPTADGSTVPIAGGSSPVLQSQTTGRNDEYVDGAVGQYLQRLGTITEYTVFDHNVNAQIQARDGAKWFNEGFNLTFPSIRLYIVFGGTNDELNSYSPHKPNFIELHGVTNFNVVLADEENPVDVAYIELVNPGRAYTDQAMFWEAFKTKIDFGKYGRPDELHVLISSMMVEVGNRIHVKAGYGNNPNELDTVFNGEITIVEEDDVLRVVAEGYGRETVMKRRGLDEPRFLSSKGNSSTRESIADMLLNFEEVQSLGKRNLGVYDTLVNSLFNLIAGDWNPFDNARFAADTYDPEGRTPNSGIGGDDSWTWWMIRSYISLTDASRRQPLLKNIYAEEIGTLDGEFQWSWFNTSINRTTHNHLIMLNNTIWEMMRPINYRHPNTTARIFNYEHEATMFFGIKDQCYLANDLNMELQVLAAKSTSQNVDNADKYKDYAPIYERMKYKRYKAVSQIHLVSSGVNLVSNGMKVSSDFATEINVYISNAFDKWFHLDSDLSVDQGKRYWEYTQVNVSKLDDNLKPNAIRSKDLKMMGCDDDIASIRFGTSDLMREVGMMYAGDIVILATPKVKNGDTVFLNDLGRGILGFVEVADCKHYFNSDSGFITVFSPRLISEAKTPYFTNLSKKLRVAFARAASVMITKNAQNIEASNLYMTLNAMVDLLGTTHAGPGQVSFPILVNLKNMARSDMLTAGSMATISASLSVFLTERSVTAARAMFSPATRAAFTTARSVWSYTRAGSVINGFLSIARSAFGYAFSDTATFLAKRTFIRGVVAVLTRSLVSIATVALANPVAATIITAAVILAFPLVSTIERNALNRDPINIMPVTLYGRAYIAGMNGAQQGSLFADTLENLKNTMKNAKFVFSHNFDRARIQTTRPVSVFEDYDQRRFY